MPDDHERRSPEILRAIQDAERKVDRMLRSAEHEASLILEQARAQAEALLADRRRAIEERKSSHVANATAEAEREAERMVSEAREKADDLKARCTAKMDEAVELVLQRILPEGRLPFGVFRSPSSVSGQRSADNGERTAELEAS